MNGKPSSPVLRGLGASDGARLLDHGEKVTLQLRGDIIWEHLQKKNGRLPRELDVHDNESRA